MADRIPIVTKTVGTGADGLKEMSPGETTGISHGGTGADTAAQALVNLGAASDTHTHTKADVGLGNVDNTADIDKPLSSAMSAAIAGRAPLSHTHTKADITDLGSVVNSTDVLNIVSITQTAYDALGTPVPTTLYLITGP